MMTPWAMGALRVAMGKNTHDFVSVPGYADKSVCEMCVGMCVGWIQENAQSHSLSHEMIESHKRLDSID